MREAELVTTSSAAAAGDAYLRIPSVSMTLR